MGRNEKPLPLDSGLPQVEVAAFLRACRIAAGEPTYEAMVAAAGYSRTSLSGAAGGEVMPSLECAKAYTRACGGDIDATERVWRSAVARGKGSDRPADPERVATPGELVRELTLLLHGNGLFGGSAVAAAASAVGCSAPKTTVERWLAATDKTIPLPLLENLLTVCEVEDPDTRDAWRRARARAAGGTTVTTPAPAHLSIVPTAEVIPITARSTRGDGTDPVVGGVPELVGELKMLRRGRGVHAVDLNTQLGPTLRRIAGIEDDTDQASTRAALIHVLQIASTRLPSSDAKAFSVALGFHHRAQDLDFHFLDQRIAWLAHRTARDPRTVRRRVDDAIRLAAEHLMNVTTSEQHRHRNIDGSADILRPTSL